MKNNAKVTLLRHVMSGGEIEQEARNENGYW
jgi:hypothetical protein